MFDAACIIRRARIQPLGGRTLEALMYEFSREKTDGRELGFLATLGEIGFDDSQQYLLSLVKTPKESFSVTALRPYAHWVKCPGI